jgi:uncharacterized glyoxalase superfamily protein PhnB
MLSIILTVSDCNASRTFYIQHLGFREVGPTMTGPDGEIIYAAVARDGVTLLLDATEPETAAAHDRGKGIALHLSLPHETNIDALYEHLKEAHVPVMLEATDRHIGERMFAICDPDGYSITITRKVMAAGANPAA